jgi:hypothetical protein
MMSSQFSYDLDERQIRIMMQDAEADGNEVLWTKFESMATLETKSPVNIGHLLPSFNLSISRSIIVPVLFVVLIGGLSAMLFSFIDFRKKELIDKEIPLVANPENYKKKEVFVDKTEKPKVAKVLPAITTATLNREITAKVVPTTPSATPMEKKVEQKIVPPVEKPKTNVVISVEPKNSNQHKVIPRKKSPKVKSEVLPTINATTITNLNDESSEPELDLK